MVAILITFDWHVAQVYLQKKEMDMTGTDPVTQSHIPQKGTIQCSVLSSKYKHAPASYETMTFISTVQYLQSECSFLQLNNFLRLQCSIPPQIRTTYNKLPCRQLHWYIGLSLVATNVWRAKNEVLLCTCNYNCRVFKPKEFSSVTNIEAFPLL
jgi:hypothetical protein